MKSHDLDAFTQSYINAALWSSTGEDDEPLDKSKSASDLSDSALESMAEDCRRFQQANAADLSEAYAHPGYQDIFASHRHDCEQGRIDALAGHDFWLTRNGHGVGFWDRDLDEVGDRLTVASEAFGSVDMYVGDDGGVYCS